MNHRSDWTTAARPRTSAPSLARLGAVGAATLFLAIGLGRFAYTPLLPALIVEGQISAAQGGYIGASNLFGYLIGALAAPALTHASRGPKTRRICLVLSVASLAACALPWGFLWLLAWRLLIGITAGVLIVGAISALLGAAPGGRVGRVAGLIFMGPGAGILISGSMLPMLLGYGASVAWLSLAAMGALAAGLAWVGWPADSDRAPTTMSELRPAGRASLGRPASPGFRRLLAAHVLFGAAIVPHTIYWGDFVARGLGFGVSTAGALWAVAGLAGIVGPALTGLTADRAGFAPALFGGLLCLALGLFLPVASGGLATIALSALLFGAFNTGMSTLMSGRTRTLVPVIDLPVAWSRMTIAVSIGQAVGGYAIATLFALIGGFEAVFLSGVAAALIAALLCLPSGGERD